MLQNRVELNNYKQLEVRCRARREAARLAVIAGRTKKFSENTSTIPEVMDSSTLNFNPNFKFSRFFRWGTPVPLPVCASKPWSISSVCKSSGRSRL